ncbi:MAG: hypothetical protein LBO72_09730 [Helicobacteraceae bacterium]|jgi:hypothetical protein|nr:hypothetical protein [Helicobacteraceae bacterium]
MQLRIKARVIDPKEPVFAELKIKDTDANLGEGVEEIVVAYGGKRVAIAFGDIMNAAIAAIDKLPSAALAGVGAEIDASPDNDKRQLAETEKRLAALINNLDERVAALEVRRKRFGFLFLDSATSRIMTNKTIRTLFQVL